MKAIYNLIKKIVGDNEPNSKDEFEVLDKFFENLPFWFKKKLLPIKFKGETPMYIPIISDIYFVISDIILRFEPNADDEIAWLDRIFGIVEPY